jgi:hypothetical protein
VKADQAGCTAGTNCSNWKDHSSYANNVETYGTMTLQPANATHNFQPYFSNFSSSNHFREANSSFAENGKEANITVVALARPVNPETLNSNTNYGGRMIGFDDSADQAGEPGFGINRTHQRFYKYTNTESRAKVNPFTVGQNAVFAWRVKNGSVNSLLNGKSTTTSTSNTTKFMGKNMNIGYGNRFGDAFPGDIQEIVVFSGNLLETDIQKVESYFAVKYGITLDQTSPFSYVASDGSVVWSAGTAGNYKRGITGIGRDDGSALLQKQSTSAQGDVVVLGVGTLASSNAANASSFATDKTFLMWAHNGGSLARTASNAPAGRVVLERAWQIQEKQANGLTMTLRVSENSSSANEKLPEHLGNLYLLLDDDGDFSTGSVEIPLTSYGTQWEGTFTVSSATPYFSFASESLPVGTTIAP